MPERSVWLRLALARDIGPRTARRLLAESDDPWASRKHLPERLNKALDAAQRIDPAPLLARCAQHGIEVLCPDDARWPAQWEMVNDAPLVLFVAGNADLLHRRPMLAVVGARAAMAESALLARRWSEQLAQAGVTIVAPIERGINEAALKGADAPCIGVLAGGHLRLSAAASELAEHLLGMGGAVISALPPDAGPAKGGFSRRNLLLALLADALLVVQAGRTSGALLVAEWAAELGKEVCVVPGPAWIEAYAGSHALIRQGALLVDEPEQVAECLGVQAKPLRPSFAPRNEAEAQVLAALSEQPLHLDALAERTALTWEKLAPILLALEMAGAIERLPGDRYALCQGGKHG